MMSLVIYSIVWYGGSSVWWWLEHKQENQVFILFINCEQNKKENLFSFEMKCKMMMITLLMMMMMLCSFFSGKWMLLVIREKKKMYVCGFWFYINSTLSSSQSYSFSVWCWLINNNFFFVVVVVELHHYIFFPMEFKYRFMEIFR